MTKSLINSWSTYGKRCKNEICAAPCCWRPAWYAPSLQSIYHSNYKDQYLEIRSWSYSGHAGLHRSFKNFWSRISVVVNRNTLKMVCINIGFGENDNTTLKRKDRQGSIFILLVFLLVYSVLWRHQFRIWRERGSQWCPSLSPYICTI